MISVSRIVMSLRLTVVAALGMLLFAAGYPAGAQDANTLEGTAVVEPHVARAKLLTSPPAVPEDVSQRSEGAPGPIPRPPDRPGAAEAQVMPTSPETVVGQPRSSDTPLSAPNDFVVQRNTSLGWAGTHGQTSSTNEPSLGESNSDVVFFSGNWYASLSLDGGQTFSYINPYTTFPASYGGFCCDQVVHYNRSHDMFIWLLQYVSSGGANIQRFAVATSADLRNGWGWTYWDITPQFLGWPNLREWDFPDMSVGSNYLYATSNLYSTSNGNWAGSTVWRMSLAELAAKGSVNVTYYSSADHGSPRLTQGATTTMYWGSWDTTSSIRIYDWTDAGAINYSNVNINAFNWMDRYTAHAVSPDGTDFANFADSRILGAWTNGGEIGFMWNAKEGGGFAYPQVQVARFNMAKVFTSQVPIWNSGHAWLFPSVNVDSRGHMGGSIAWGGGSNYPQAAVWIADDVNGTTIAPLENYTVTGGTNGPASNRWGDYLTSRKHPGFAGNSWVASAYSLVGGMYGANAEPRFVWFGRQRDLPISFSYSDQTLTGSAIPGYYSFPVLSNSWSAVGINPVAADHDVYVDNHTDFSAPYASSTGLAGVRDFTVTNGFIWGNATHYAEVTFSTPSTYYLEAEWGLPNLTLGVTRSSSFLANEVLEAVQVNLTAGQKYVAIGTVTSGSTDPALFMFSPSASAGSRYSAPWSINSNGAGGMETLAFTPTTSGWHCMVMTDENGASGGYSMIVGPTPANDECGNATGIGSLPYSTSEDTRFATTAGTDPNTMCGSGTFPQQSKSVWFTVTPGCSAQMQVDTFTSDYDTVIEVYSGTCGALVPVVCNDDYGGYQSNVAWSATAGTTYYIEAMAYGSVAGGNLAFHLSYVPPANDNCASAILLTNPDDTRTQAGLGGTTEVGEPISSCVSSIYDTVWYQFVPAQTGVVTLSTLGSSYDTVLAVYTGACGALTLQACNDDQRGGSDLTSALALNVTAGVTYRVQVGSYGPAGGCSLGLEYHSGPPCTTIAAARCLAPGTRVSLCNKTLTGSFAGTPFMQESDRSAGTAIGGSGPNPGTPVTLVGTTQVTAEGDFYVAGNAVGIAYPSALSPVGMTNKTVGGAVACNQAGVTGGAGVNNVGLLVRTWGTVLSVDTESGTYWIDDGSNLVYNTDHTGLRVWTFGAPPNPGSYCLVTGYPWMWSPAGTPILLEVSEGFAGTADLDKSQRTNGGPAKANLGPSPLLGH